SAGRPIKAILLGLFFICIFSLSPLFADEVSDEVHIDADSVIYQGNTGIATADGSVKVRNKNMRMFAPRLEYNSSNQIIEAFSDERGKITLFSGQDKLTGDHLSYNIAQRKGMLTNVSGKMDAFFIKGTNLKVMSADDAVKFGVISSQGSSSSDELVGEWLDVSATTCDFEKPHYRFVSKKIIVIPNKKVIVKKPKVYIGESCIFTYPFDYIAKLTPRDQSVMPYLAYESDKGMGVGIKGALDFGKMGELMISGIYWTEDIWEAKLNYRKEIVDGLSVFIASNRLYNSDDDDIMWRPKWGMEYLSPSGWRAVLFQSQRELVQTEMRPGQEKRYNVWSDPEFGIYSPWFGDASKGFRIRGFGILGRYQDNLETAQPWIERLVLGAEINGFHDKEGAVLRPYYGARYVYHSYDGGENTQDIIDGWVGVKWNLGEVQFDTMYFRRWADGISPLVWDRYEDNDTFYQTVSFPLPFGESWEKWTFSVRASYDGITNEFADMRYSLNYNKHCISWHIWLRDERASGELTAGLFFYINAYPDYKIGIESETNSEAVNKGF
ncbi:MAG: hypothetical protein PHO18_07590, partial [Synergistaceae bacterium]|nr:hypothetical protein [Synergistaceae bacterium]